MRESATLRDLHGGPIARQHGVGLVELMIALVVGLFLMAGVLVVYDKSKRTYRYMNALAEVQEQGRFAIGFLTRSLRVAGFPGDNMPPGNKIEGTDGATDTVTVRLREDVDCNDAVTGGVATNRFRIDANRLECSGDGVTWDVYVDNVEDMQIVYGEDLDGDGVANRYVTATQGPTWVNVVAARVSLLVRSTDSATPQPEEFRNLAGNTVAAADRRLRRPVETTIALRN